MYLHKTDSGIQPALKSKQALYKRQQLPIRPVVSHMYLSTSLRKRYDYYFGSKCHVSHTTHIELRPQPADKKPKSRWLDQHDIDTDSNTIWNVNTFTMYWVSFATCSSVVNMVVIIVTIILNLKLLSRFDKMLILASRVKKFLIIRNSPPCCHS